jgi:site-specific DNA-methyltransferase (adenine-specific)
MFSFAGDTVLDPFAGTFTTTLAAMKATRNSIGNELDDDYFEAGKRRVEAEADKMGGLFDTSPLVELTQPA